MPPHRDFLGVEPVLFYSLQSLRDGGIGIGFGLPSLYGQRSGNNQTEETDVSDESSWHCESPSYSDFDRELSYAAFAGFGTASC